MIVSYKWLQRYVDIKVSPEELAKKVTMAGIEVEGIHYPAQDIHNVKVGQIKTIRPHENSDKLQICLMDMGDELLQVVTGAPNIAVGQKVPVALENATLPGDFRVEKTVLRGVESFGMLCSMAELAIDDSAEAKAGLWVLPEDAPLGADIVAYMDLDDAYLELGLTPNRSDCLSVLNFAKEVAAVLHIECNEPDLSYMEGPEKIEKLAKITVEDTDLCKRYTARLVKNIKIGPSPWWMQQCLRSAGMRPINNIVDIGNFVLLEMGVPLHTFDYDTLTGHEIIVRRGEKDEKIITLDNQERFCDEETLLICDAEKAVCVAGIMGGLNTEVEPTTTNILIEAARFDPVCIRHTSRRLGLRSEASLRFEKGIDLFTIDKASRRCAQLLVELGGGTAVEGVLDSYAGPAYENKVIMRKTLPNELLGTSYTEQEVKDVFDWLHFSYVEKEGCLEVEIPSFRQDITRPVDLVEEIARLQGYDKIPITLPIGATTEGKRTEKQIFFDDLRKLCVSCGLHEVVNYSFINPTEWDKLLLPSESAYRNTVKISNPLTEEQSIMRTTLLPGLLKNASYNQSRRITNLKLAEIGAVFLPSGKELPDEKMHLGVLAMGEEEQNWLTNKAAYDYFYLKGILEKIAKSFGIENWQVVVADDIPFLHPGKSAKIMINGQMIGFIGELHPNVLKNYGVVRTSCMEIDLEAAFMACNRKITCQPLPKYPAIHRDIALMADIAVPVATIEEVIRKAAGDSLVKIGLFDVYQGSQLPNGKRSLAYNLTFQAMDRTLKDSEVNEAFDRVVEQLQEELGVQLR